MTKYVLAGGSDRLYPDYGKRLADFVNNEVKFPRLLGCFFSQSKEERESKRADWEAWYDSYFPTAKSLLIADEEHFLEQIAESDVVYLHGGETRRLKEALPDAKIMRKVFDGKIVVGSSAGANCLTYTSYSPSADSIQKGMGLIDIGVVVHYGASSFNGKEYTVDQWRRAVTGVKSQLGDRPLLLLPEGNFTVIEQ